MKKNPELKTAIFKAGKTQRKVAKETRIPEAHISMAIHGKFNLNPIQREKIAGVLGVSSREIFPEMRTA